MRVAGVWHLWEMCNFPFTSPAYVNVGVVLRTPGSRLTGPVLFASDSGVRGPVLVAPGSRLTVLPVLLPSLG